MLGKDEGRRGNDVNSGTLLVWGGNSSDPLIDLRSRNCTIENFQITVPSGKTLTAAILSDDTGGLSEIITTNYFKKLYVNPDGGGTFTDGVRMGSSGGANQEHHRWEGCSFAGALNAGVFADNGTGQMKFLQFEDCAFLSCRYGWLAQIASADFTRCNFSGISETCMRWTGGSYDPCTVTDCDNESSAQFVYAPGVDISFINTRLSCENAFNPPNPTQEYIYGPNKLLMLNTQVQNDNEDVFAIRPADGGYVAAISCDFPDREFMPSDISWQAVFLNCPRISDGIRKSGFGMTNRGHYLNVTEIAGSLRVSNQGAAPTTLNATAADAFDLFWDRITNYTRLSQAGGYPKQPVTVQTYGDKYGTTAVFSSASGSVPANAYDYAYTVVTAAGESLAIKLATGHWTLTNLPLGPAGTTGRNLYRSPSGADTYKKLATIANNTTTTYVDSAAAGSGDPPVSDTSGLATSLQLGTLTPTAVITAAGGTIGTWDGTIVFNVDGVLVKVPYKL